MNENYSYSDKHLSYRQRSDFFQSFTMVLKKMIFLFFISVITSFWTQMSAEGSKDFYPSGVSGNRAFLYSNSYEAGGTTIRSWPFKTLGTHYVYAKVGETIAVASSAQNAGNGKIRLIAPDGTVYITASNNIGRIASRTEELAGPLYPGQAAGSNRYQPFNTVVGTGQEGVWRVEFLPSGSETSSSTPGVTDVAADANWTQGTNTELIAAWDVSVRNSGNSAWVNGRVYTNVLNLHISGSAFTANKAFYGSMYVLTRDGIAYKVVNNGSNGVGFTFFVNNKGFLNTANSPSYKSLNISDPLDSQFRIHDPRSADAASNVTHKIFYGKPALDLPTSGNMSGGMTWLKNAVLTPTATNITYTGVEGTPDLSGNKGAHIGFDSNLSGTYRIEIIGDFPTRIINGNCTVGTNTVFWDGKDGNGNILPAGTNIGEIRVQLFGAEVHFPFIDMEINPGGIIIEQLDTNYDVYVPTRDLVYWDDSDVTGGMATHKSNPIASGITGISSNSNGHKWGLYTSGSSGSGNSGTGSSSFGNEKSMDTWSFVPGQVIVKNLDVVVAAADLEVVSITPSTTTVNVGQQMNYTVTVVNNGPSAVTGAGFTFIVPSGFTINTVSYVNSQGTVVVVNGTIDPVTGNYTANLDMTNGGQIVFTFTGTVGAALGGQPLTVEASIIRPADVTDPDATNPGTNPPTNPHVECLNGTTTENCNNIKYNTITPAVTADLAVLKIADNMTPMVGESITFTIVATNNGLNNATNVSVTDQLQDGYAYVSSTVTTGTYNANNGLWTIGNLANGAIATLTITATVTATGNYGNTATITGAETDPNVTNNTSTIIPTRRLNIIDAVNDSVTNVNGYTGATNVVNVYTNDTLNGTAVNPSQVTLTTTVSNPNLILNPNGSVDVIPGTPAGPYTLTYQICEIANPTNCDTATVTVTVVAPVIDAVNDSATNVNGYTGATNVVNVYTNDTLNGTAVTPSQVTLTTTVSNPNLILNPNGSVDVIPGTPAGPYTLTYQICEIANPTNCDTATVTVTVVAPAIDAVNDSATNVNGYTGATNVVNVYTNDTLNGTAVTPSQVTLTTTVSNPNLTLNPDGSVDVIPGTPAGPYTLTYQICEIANPTNCDTATVTVTVVAPAIDAVNDSATNVNGYTGATNVVNVYTNDTLNGTAVTPSQVTLTTTVSNPNLILNPNGSVDVIPGTPAGPYTLTYQICEIANPTNCDTAIVTVTVVAPVIDAVNDSATNVNGYTGATNVVNVYTNDTLNGTAVTPSQVTLTTTVSNPYLTLNPNGSVDVIPGTPAGPYTLTYQICEIANPTNCDTATVTVTVVAPAIDAVNDSATNINGYTGATNVVNVYTNDTLNGTAVTPSQVTLTTTVSNPNLILNPNGSVDVIPGTPAGPYTLTYQICEIANPTNCDTATVTVTVVAPAIDAVNDSATNINGYTGATNVVNVYTNDTLNGTAVTPSQVTLTTTVSNPNLILNPNGSVDVIPGTPAGPYTITYQICEIANPTNCDTATVTITVVAPVIDAVNDSATNINGYTGATNVVNVYTNDTLNGTAVTPSQVTLTTTVSNPNLILNPNGSVDVIPGTPAGPYTLTYQICEIANPTNCDTATVTVTVIAPVIDAVNDSATNVNGYTGATNVVNVYTNDTLNGTAVTPSQVTLTTTVSNPNLILNPNGSVDVIPGTPAGPYTLTYQICEIANPTNCDTATVTVTVVAPAIDAVNDSVTNVNGYTGATNVVNVYTNDTLNGTAVTPSQVTLTTTVSNPNLILNPNGSVDVIPGTPAGPYTITYQICEIANPTNCDTATVTITVVAPVIDAVNDSATNINGYTGATNVVNVYTNDTLNGTAVTPSQVTLTTTVSNPNLILNPNGSVDVIPGTPAGPYTLTYQICEIANPTNCDTATVTVTVIAPVIDAVNDSATNVNGYTGATNVVNVYTNDTLNGTAVTPSQVTLTTTVSNPNLILNPNGSVDVIPGTPGGTHTLTYQICEIANPTNCDTAVVTVFVMTPQITLTKEALSGTYNAVGNIINYTLTVTNTGNVTITNLLVTDNNADAGSISPATIAILGAGQHTTVSATHTITQADLNNGFVHNLATVTGQDPVGGTVTDESEDPTNPAQPGDNGYDPSCPKCTVTPLTQNPAIALVKTAVFNDTNADTFAQVGETITYTFTVTNTGNVTINGLVINDTQIGLTNAAVTPATLAPGATGTATATYVLTQTDINAGQISNTAIATGTTPQGGTVQDTSGTSTTNDTPTVTPLPQNPAIALVKTAVFNDTNADTFAQVGETITYTFTVTNTGNVTVNGLVINDTQIGLTNAAVTPATLAPGATGTATATYVLTQTDINAGQISNTAIATGSTPQGGTVQDTSGTSTTNDTPTVTPLPQNPAIALVKTAVFNDTNTDTFAQVGETITYTFTVTNTGNVTINGLVINDMQIGLTNAAVTPATLAPGATGTATATYVLTQTDINAGQISNTAIATGTTPQGGTVQDTSGTSTTNDTPTVTPLAQNPELTLFKEGTYQDANGDGLVNAGDTVLYTFTVSNTGNVTITNIDITDPAVTVTGGPLSSLAPGVTDATTFTALYIITQGDIDDGAVYNMALVEGTAPNGDPVMDDSEDPTPINPNDPLVDPGCPKCTVTPLIQNPGIALIKTGVFNDNNHDGIAQAGETITYSFTVTNTGNTSLTNITITDPLPGVVVTGGPISLAVGASDSTTFTAVYVITQADINAGAVSNQAFVTGTAPQGQTVTDSSDDNDVIGDNPTVITVDGCAINVFNAVSPNGDGSNDIFYIAGIECYPNNEIQIFNRWGVQVFETKGYNNTDKVFKGYSDGRATVNASEPLPDGTYFYILQYTTADGVSQNKNGYLYITR